MYNELSIKIGLENHKCFIKDGFYSFFVKNTPIHKHNYAEIHIVTGGTALFHVGDRLYSSDDGNLVIIPSDVFHHISSEDPNTRHTAFQVDYDVQRFAAKQMNMQTALDFMNEIGLSQITKNYAAVAAYISLFCNCFCQEELGVRPIHDYRFLICEFFFKHYHENLHLCDLAKALHLSERQTERLVIKHTGHTFRQELATVRVNIAKHLLKTTDISLDEVSRYVGYHSYAGFWKAMKKYSN